MNSNDQPWEPQSDQHSPDHEYQQAEVYKPPPESGSGGSGKCLLYGCLIFILLSLLVVVGGGLATYWFITGQVEKYTSAEPANIPVVEYSEEELEEVQGRVDAFRDKIDEGETPEPLVLTADDINALIAKDEDMRGRVFVRIEEGTLTGDISIPTDAIPGGKGRYFNASGTFDASLENGVLIVRLIDAEVNGEAVPAEIIEGMSRENLAKDAYKDPKVAETFRRFDSISIEDDRVILRPRQPDDDGPAEAIPAEAPAAEMSSEPVEESPAVESPAVDE